MRWSFILISTLHIGLTSFVKAQSEIPELVTDRPDQTEASTVVPHKFLQIETGFVILNNETDSVRRKIFSYNTTLLRYGLFDNLELRLGLDYLGEKVKVKNRDTSSIHSGFSPLYAGFKVKIADEDRWKPEIAFLGAVVLPFTAGEDFKPDHTGSILRFAFSHTLSERFSIGYNIGAIWSGLSSAPIFLYSISLGAGIADRLGCFFESYGYLPEEGEAEHLLDAGFTYLLFDNFQLDISGGIGLKKRIDNFISLGLTYRLPD